MRRKKKDISEAAKKCALFILGKLG